MSATVRTLKLTLAYDGTNYAGWQIQAGQPTLQAALELALAELTGENIRTTASGRTDSGVHALGQVVSFETQCSLAPDVFQRALNTHLPRDMAVVAAEEVRAGFHAIRNAVRKRYRYLLDDRMPPDVFRRQFAWHSRERLDAEAMHEAAALWRGRHDFKSFESQGSVRTSSVRTVFDTSVVRGWQQEPHLIAFEVEADGFLYNMVRAMTGTLVDIGRGAKPVARAGEVLAACDRNAAGMTAPPQGLYLVRVEYPPT